MSNGSAPGQPRKPSTLDQILNIFTEVKAGEGLLVVMMTLNIFLILLSYYVLKPIRDSLIVNAELFGYPGDELKSYLQPGLAVLLIFVIQGYSALASKVDRVKLLNYTSGFVVAAILAFVGLISMGVAGTPIAIAYFLWLGIINVFIIAQFWSYANDIYTEKQGKRLFAAIAIGQSVGAILGAFLTRTFGDYTTGLMVGAAVLLSISVLLYNVADRRIASEGTGGEDDDQQAGKQDQEAPLSKEGGFNLLFSSKYLLLIAALILVSNLVNTNGEFIVSNAARTESQQLFPDDAFTPEWVAAIEAGTLDRPEGLEAEDVRVIADKDEREQEIDGQRGEYLNSFFGSFYGWVNLAGFLIQAFLVSRLFGLIGVRGALFVLPLIAFGGSVLIGLVGTLLAVRIAKTAENSTDYSLQNTVKQALYLPTTREEKYKAKAAIDTFVVRVGDTLSAAIVFIGVNRLSFGRIEFAWVNAVLAVLMIFLALQLYRHHKKLVPDDAMPATK